MTERIVEAVSTVESSPYSALNFRVINPTRFEPSEYAEIWYDDDIQLFTLDYHLTEKETLDKLISAYECGVAAGERKGYRKAQADMRRVLGCN